MKIFVSLTPSHKHLTINIEPSASVLDLKQAIEKDQKLLSHDQYIVFNAKPLDDSRTLQQYGICDGTTVFLHRKAGKNHKKEKEIFAEKRKIPIPAADIESILRKQENLLPLGFRNIGELKQSYRKQKKNRLNLGLCYWDITCHRGNSSISIQNRIFIIR